MQQPNDSCQTIPGKSVQIRNDAFAFCRYGVMLMVWASLFLHNITILLIAFGILGLSVLFTVRYSPMILLYTYTIGLFTKSATQPLGINGMRFAHTLGTIFAGLALLTICFIHPRAGWVIVFFLAVMKTISAVGLCPAYKLYNCVTSGGCCSLTKSKS